jgi:hypothetical protein
MRRLYLTVMGLSWLALLGGCQCARPGCDQGCNSGCASGLGGGSHSSTHGVCDCSIEDHCTNRSPWIRTVYPVALGAPVEAVPAPARALPNPGLE